MKSEIHIVLIWEKGLNKFESILYDLKNDFKVLDVSRVKWGNDFFSNNLSRFYGEKLPDGSFKEKHCGRGDFIVIVIKQSSPIYESRKTSRGDQLVNSVLFDKKALYRKWTGGGHRVHTSNTVAESFHDIFFIFQKKIEDFSSLDSWDGDIKNREVNIKGFNGWTRFEEMFNFINISSNYVILRNYEDLNNLKPESDIDVLTSDIDFHYHINGTKKYNHKDRAAYEVEIQGNRYDVDIRTPDDGYYDSNWVLDIIENQILYKNKFFIPDPVNEFYSLLYHTLIHKNQLSDRYNKKLTDLASKIDLKISASVLGDRNKMLDLLNIFLSKRKYKITKPHDFSVQYNHTRKGFKRLVWEMIGKVKNG